MTYKEIINRFRQATKNHYMLQDFGYGQLSDLKTQSQLGPEEQGVDYPYLFLLPQAHTRQGPVMNYTFNMIVMDMARGEEGDVYDNYISIQSQCQQYIDDILGYLYFAYNDQPEIQLTNIQYNAFKEKYQDELAGMTATVTIQVPIPIDNCITPMAPPSELLVDVTSDTDQPMDPEGQNVLSYPINIVNNGQWQSFNKYVVNEDANLKFVLNQNVVFDTPGPGEIFPSPIVIREIVGGIRYQPTVSNWPATIVPGQTYNLRMQWELDLEYTGGTQWEFLYLPDEAGNESGLVQKAGGSLKIYQIN